MPAMMSSRRGLGVEQENNTEAEVGARVLARATHTVAALGTSRETETRSEPWKGAATGFCSQH